MSEHAPDLHTALTEPVAAQWFEENGTQTPVWTVAVQLSGGTRTLWFANEAAAWRYFNERR